VRHITSGAVGRKWSAFTISLVVHISAISFLAWVDVALEPASPRPHYKVIPFPDPRQAEKKVIWYNLRQSVPEVTTDQPFGPSRTPQGIKDPSGQVLIARSADPASAKQLIFQPDHPDPLPVDVPAPNLVSLPKAIPEPPVKPVPKAFQPPPSPSRLNPRVPGPIVDAPPLVDVSLKLVGAPPAPKLPPRAFVAPTRPAGSGATASRSVQDLPPPPEIGVQNGQTAALQSVVVGLDPATGLPPPGSRSAQFSRAPSAGTPSSGAASPSATIIPGLVAHGKPGDAPKAATGPAPATSDRRILKEIVLPGVNRTMSSRSNLT
jgi:hypothetical protein